MKAHTFNLPFLLQHIMIPLLFLRFHRNTLTLAAGKWDLLLSNIGISAMHMQLLNTDRVIIFDTTDFGASNISLPNGTCRNNSNNLTLKRDCTAHSVEYHVASNSVRPLTLITDPFCSSGAVRADGTLVQIGGFNDGDHNVRMYKPCSSNSCDWQEINGALVQRRWYSTSHILPDGRLIIVGGRRQFSYEFFPKRSGADKAYNLPFLAQTNDRGLENNLYPFVFLNTDGNLFIFANNRAILFDYLKRVVVKNYQQIPGGDPRNYPSSGSAVLLPLKNGTGAEVMVCGGAPRGANGTFNGALNTCGRIRINDPNPSWTMETMPMGRVMGDMLLLPTGDVLIINGAGSGAAGWESARNPILSPVIYRPNNRIGSRFEVHTPSARPRMYHSTALLIRDGRVLVSGNNPHVRYNFKTNLFPTDLSIEAFSPPYLDPRFANLRPTIVSPPSQAKIRYGQTINVRFTIPPGRLNGSSVMVTMVAPSFVTHTFSMNQRLLVLSGRNAAAVASLTFQIPVVAPSSGNLAPSGYYLLFVSHQGIPSVGIWVQIS
ncbi:galactose oxidase-like [Dorcoceras hygrometricum]|uniref:Galactose oxidase-like n=1 Tax=Dorcoceras hygrometricum TaxID=472368 RepID=A0A2Z7AB08_9LAMI|nr:galactose oxidase-like [Dorcoceras hygrometricum]